jgi:hypothetical protein
MVDHTASNADNIPVIISNSSETSEVSVLVVLNLK